MTSLKQLIHFHILLNSCVVGVRNNKTQQKIITLKGKWNKNIVLPYIKISNWVGRNDNFLAKGRKLSILPTSLDIFDIWQHYVRIFYLYRSKRVKYSLKSSEPYSSKRGHNSLPHNHEFYRPCIRNFLKALWEKEKIFATSIFSFPHNVFYPIPNKFQFFSHVYFVVCKCFQTGPV